jgi:hypothetical protein
VRRTWFEAWSPDEDNVCRFEPEIALREVRKIEKRRVEFGRVF